MWCSCRVPGFSNVVLEEEIALETVYDGAYGELGVSRSDN